MEVEQEQESVFPTRPEIGLAEVSFSAECTEDPVAVEGRTRSGTWGALDSGSGG